MSNDSPPVVLSGDALTSAPLGDDGLFKAATQIIEKEQSSIARYATSIQVLANWQLGRLIDSELLSRGRGDYGKEIVTNLSHRLTQIFGNRFDRTSLNRMVKFSREFPEPISATLWHQLSWSHIKELLPLKSVEARQFYAEETVARNLGVRELHQAVSRKAFERREIANSQIPEGSAVPQDVFRDPMLLDILGLKETYLESDLENAIVHELESFLLEAGRGWTFVERQKRMQFGEKDYHLDLLFYSRPLRRLIAVELKLGEFLPEYKGQMDFYLKWLNEFDRQPGEEPPVGLILCTEASRDQIEFLELHKDNILVAEYWTDLPPKAELTERIAKILRDSQERLARRGLRGTPAGEIQHK